MGHDGTAEVFFGKERLDRAQESQTATRLQWIAALPETQIGYDHQFDMAGCDRIVLIGVWQTFYFEHFRESFHHQPLIVPGHHAPVPMTQSFAAAFEKIGVALRLAAVERW